MTDEQIIEMARQAGLHVATDVNWMPVIGLAYAKKLVEVAAQHEREWVGLTYEDMIEVWNKLYKERTDVMPLPTTFAKAIEAKLKEKNT